MEAEDRATASGHESIEVVIRIKPRIDDPCDQEHRKCVFLSPSEPNTIVVETPNKKEFFSFDRVAAEDSQQQEIYDSIGQPALEEAFKVLLWRMQGYNCCIFAYGQTGAGKTYSILGNSATLAEDYYCESRGILPRLLEQLFILSRRPSYTSCEVRCSYLEIYNEQIIDLLNKDIRAYQIREDHRRGVYVEGMSEERVSSYEESLAMILRGLKNRKIAATSMNSESSRSHTIFSIAVSVQLQEGGVQKQRFSKVHIVDLAGSQRTKLAKVEGDRLREGCNINKSLHALGNVINSLVESARKKKYIPFRDSKLTYFLKDSLGGNSKTTLLANINPARAYLGDTISTLMFAKRAKIIKVRVEANENIADNFESLRNEIRKLREELAQTKFIKNEPKPQELDETVRQRFVDLSLTDLDQTQQRVLRVFEENEGHFRSLVALYKQRLASAASGPQHQRSQLGFKNMFEQKKNLEKSCASYEALLANVPAFTRIFRENLELKRKAKLEDANQSDLSQKFSDYSLELEALRNNNRFLKGELAEISSENISLRQHIQELVLAMNNMHSKYSVIHARKDGHCAATHTAIPSEQHSPVRLQLPKLQLLGVRHNYLADKNALSRRDQLKIIVNKQNEMLQQYELAIAEVKERLGETINELKQSYQQLERELEAEREYKHSLKRQTTNKRKDVPVQLETLENENEYLKLNVMELETELARVQDQNFRKEIELRTVQEETDKLRSSLTRMEKVNEEHGMKEKELVELFERVRQVQEAALREQRQIEEERNVLEEKFKELQTALVAKMKENYELAAKNESLTSSNAALKRKLSEILKVESEQSVIMNKESACWTTLEEDNISEDFTLEKTLNGDLVKELDRVTSDRDTLLDRLEEEQKKLQEEHGKLEKASNKILGLTRDLAKLKEENKHESEQLRRLQMRAEEFETIEKCFRDKNKLLEYDFNRMRRQHQQTQQLIQRTRDELGKDLPEIVEEYKTLRIRNQVLNQENERLRNLPVLQSETRTTGQSANTKSMRYLPVVKESELTTPRMNSTQKLDDMKQFLSSTTTLSQRQPEQKRRESFGTPTPAMLKKLSEVRQQQQPPTVKPKEKQTAPRK